MLAPGHSKGNEKQAVLVCIYTKAGQARGVLPEGKWTCDSTVGSRTSIATGNANHPPTGSRTGSATSIEHVVRPVLNHYTAAARPVRPRT